jgi:hypothetical protein
MPRIEPIIPRRELAKQASLEGRTTQAASLARRRALEGAACFEAASSLPQRAGYAINLGGLSETLKVKGRKAIRIYHAEIEDDDGECELSPAERHFCARCATALWLYDERWPELIHPFASAIDTPLPKPPSRVHLMLRYKPDRVVPRIGKKDQVFDEYPEQSIADWHKSRKLWVK